MVYRLIQNLHSIILYDTRHWLKLVMTKKLIYQYIHKNNVIYSKNIYN